MISEQADEPPKISDAPSALGEALQEQIATVNWSNAFVCYTRCWSCMSDYHHEEPTWHTWADSDDVAHAADTGQQDPSTQRCACWCAESPKETPSA